MHISESHDIKVKHFIIVHKCIYKVHSLTVYMLAHHLPVCLENIIDLARHPKKRWEKLLIPKL